jgi:tetratricopeptide (TPR) repeat protein
VGILQEFKSKVLGAKEEVDKIRHGAEDFKTKHKMTSQVISKLIKGLPPPFNSFGEIIWDGLEKIDGSDQKMLDILEKIGNNNEVQFGEIRSSINKLIENNASKSDLQQLGREILDSNKEVVQIISNKVDEILPRINEVDDNVKRVEKGVEEIKTILLETKQGNSSQIQILRLEKIELHPRLYRRENPTSFVGREYYINKIKDHLKNPGRRVSIVGLGGTGKSTLAFRALHVCEDMFYQIIPFYFESEYTIEEFTSQLANSLSLTTQELERHDIEDQKTILLNELSSRGGKRSLIFVDNYETISGALNIRPSDATSPSLSIPSEDIKHISDFLNRIPTNTSILLTSRERRNIDNENIIDLEGLNKKEGKELFIKLAGSEYLRQDPPMDLLMAIEDLVEKLGGHPLSIEILARTYIEGSPEEEVQNMSVHLGYTPSRETQERLQSLKSCFEYSIRQLDRGLREFLYFLVLFKSPFPISASQIFGAEKYYVLDLYSRSLIQRIDHNEYGQIKEQEHWLYTFHPSMRIYLDEQTKNGIQNLEIKYGSTFSEFYLNLLYDTYTSIKKENRLSALARFNIIYQGKENDFERAAELTAGKQQSAHILRYLGFITYELGMLSKELDCHNKALKIDKELNDRVGMGNDYTNIGNVLRNMGNYPQALEHNNKALEIHTSLNDKVGMGNDYTNIGLVLSNMGDYPQALEHHNKALEIDKELKDRVGMAKDYGNIGLVLSNMGDNQRALENHNKALEIDKELNDKVGMGANYANIGVVLRTMGSYQQALECHNKALEIHEELEDRVGMAKDYANIGIVLRTMGSYQQALECHNKALEIHTSLNDKVGIARDCGNIGNALSNMGSYQQALECHNKALEIHTSLNDKIGMGTNYANIGAVLKELNKHKEAAKSVERGLNILLGLEKETGYHYPLIDTLKQVKESLKNGST